MTTFHDFTLKTIDGDEKSLADYRGQALLVVNVASRCGLTPQYSALEALHRQYRERGALVVGFPCNDFGAQEPGSESDIKSFCSTQYDVTFPMFAKVEVLGPSKAPLYTWLTKQEAQPEGPGDIAWNFAKFVIGKDGRVVARFAPTVTPDAPEVKEALDRALGDGPSELQV